MLVQGCRIVFPQAKTADLELFTLDDSDLAPDELTGRMIVSLISPGTEIAVYKGYEGFAYPLHPGYAAVFHVEKTGENIHDLKSGDLVFGMFAHQSVVRAKRRDVLLLKPGMKAETVVFARIAAISMTTLVTTAARPPQKVLVSGMGIVGNIAAQIFQQCGYELLACDPGEQRREMARQVGIQNVIDRIPVDDPTVAGSISLVVECRGNEHDVLDGCNVVCPGGEVVLVGVPWGRRTDTYAFDILSAVFHKYAILRSGWEWEIPTHTDQAGQCSVYGNFAQAMQWLSEGRIMVDGLFGMENPRSAPEIYRKILSRESNKLTYLLDWRNM